MRQLACSIGLPLPAKRFAGALLCFLMLLLPGGAPGPVRAQDAGNSGLILRYPDGQVETYCVAVPVEGLTALEQLQRAGLPLRLEMMGNGAAICAIRDQGCTDPAAPCFCQCQGADCRYWTFYHWQGERWVAAVLGASNYTVRPGGVAGWGWGAPPPAPSGEALCGVTAAPSPAPPTLAPPLPTATRRPAPPPTATRPVTPPPTRRAPTVTPPAPSVPDTAEPAPPATRPVPVVPSATSPPTAMVLPPTATRPVPTATLPPPTDAAQPPSATPAPPGGSSPTPFPVLPPAITGDPPVEALAFAGIVIVLLGALGWLRRRTRR